VLNALVEGEEKERSRLARELHDGVGGILSASKMHLSIIEDEEHYGPKATQLKNVSSLLDQAAQEIRTIAHNLFPDILLMHDLDVAISYYCLGKMPKLNNHFKLIVYRAVQELVNNVMKHAHADHVLVQLSKHDNVMTIVVEDNGVGFDEKVPKGMGLLNLADKVKNLDGQFSIESAPGKGTTVVLEFNLEAAPEYAVLESTTA
jgi:signal transduction histidine kinase